MKLVQVFACISGHFGFPVSKWDKTMKRFTALQFYWTKQKCAFCKAANNQMNNKPNKLITKTIPNCQWWNRINFNSHSFAAVAMGLWCCCAVSVNRQPVLSAIFAHLRAKLEPVQQCRWQSDQNKDFRQMTQLCTISICYQLTHCFTMLNAFIFKWTLPWLSQWLHTFQVDFMLRFSNEYNNWLGCGRATYLRHFFLLLFRISRIVHAVKMRDETRSQFFKR